MIGCIKPQNGMRTSQLAFVGLLFVASTLIVGAWLAPHLWCHKCGSTVWLTASEPQSLATSGKWLGKRYNTDAFSGEIAIYYNTLSPYLMN